MFGTIHPFFVFVLSFFFALPCFAGEPRLGPVEVLAGTEDAVAVRSFGGAPAALINNGEAATGCVEARVVGVTGGAAGDGAGLGAPEGWVHGGSTIGHGGCILPDTLDATSEIYSRRGGEGVRLTENGVFDGEPAVCAQDGSILFTRLHEGDLELFRMASDGSEVERLTEAAGYDGGATWSADCRHIAWHASRPRGRALESYRQALAQGLLQRGETEIWVAEADGSDARRLTYLDAGSRHPAFFPGEFPGGSRLVFASDLGGDRELWSVGFDGAGLERVTFAPGSDDGALVVEEDGETWVLWASTRDGQPRAVRARWDARAESALPPEAPSIAAAADRVRDSIHWLADDAREGRGVETEGLEASARWLAERFAALGLEPGGEEGFFHAFEVPIRVSVAAGTALSIDGSALDEDAFAPLAFSASGEVEAEVVSAGYGISAADLSHDDYAELDVEGKVVVVRRFTPPGARFEDNENQRRYGGLRYKAFQAREHGAVGLLVVDWPELAPGEPLPEESAMPDLRVDSKGDAGLPVAMVRRDVGKALFEGGHRARLAVHLDLESVRVRNVVAKLPVSSGGASDPLDGEILVGAHFDHLGYGGRGSFDPDSGAIHNGADDNASGTAALVEIARGLVERREELDRTVWLAAFSAEESGLLGSTALVRNPPAGLEPEELLAMINLDMVGRLRQDRVQVLGAASAEEWEELVPPICLALELDCKLGGDGYGPSDQTPFYAAGVPVLHWFTGTHEDYHRPSDDAPKINAVGAARIAAANADLVVELAQFPGRLSYREAEAPVVGGDMRSFGASLGTIPDYAGSDRPGVPLSGARAGSAAEKAGVRKGDLIVAIGGREVRNIYDFVYILRSAKPGATTMLTVLRDGEEVTMEITYDEGRRRP